MATKLKLIDLHRLSYAKSLHIQQRLFTKVQQDDKLSYLLMVEHDPVYTVGIRHRHYLDQDLQTKLKSYGADFVVTNRGGLITFHGPGQLVVYPIVNIKRLPVTNGGSIRKFVHQLESSIIDTCRSIGIKTDRLCGYPGVWVDGQRKIAALGIHCSRYVTMHGISINCNVDLNWYEHIVPCGIEDKQVTSLEMELNQEIKMEHVKNLFVKHFCLNLDCSIVDHF